MPVVPFPAAVVAPGDDARAGAVHDDDGHHDGVLRDVAEEGLRVAVEHFAQAGVVFRFLVVEGHRHTPEVVGEGRVLAVLLQQVALQLPAGELLRHGDDAVAGGGDDDGGVAGVDDVVDVAEAESHVGGQVGVGERLEDVGVELHLALLVEGGLLEELLGGGSQLVALADGAGPEPHLGLLGLTHLVGHAVHLPQGPQGQHDGQRQQDVFQVVFHSRHRSVFIVEAGWMRLMPAVGSSSASRHTARVAALMPR